MKPKILLSSTAMVAAMGLILRARAASWRRETAAMIETLEREAMADGAPVCFADFAALPAPVAAYFRFALQDGQKRIRTATLRHEGQFMLGDKWVPFASIQHFSARPAALVYHHHVLKLRQKAPPRRNGRFFRQFVFAIAFETNFGLARAQAALRPRSASLPCAATSSLADCWLDGALDGATSGRHRGDIGACQGGVQERSANPLAGRRFSRDFHTRCLPKHHPFERF